jgi:hypothetical protein
MSWPNNSFNFWKSRLISGKNPFYRASAAALLLLLFLIVLSGCSGGGAALDGLSDDLEIIDLGEGNAMKNEQAEQKERMPIIDQHIPEGLETATLALG